MQQYNNENLGQDKSPKYFYKKVAEIFGGFENFSYLCIVESEAEITAQLERKIFLVHE